VSSNQLWRNRRDIAVYNSGPQCGSNQLATAFDKAANYIAALAK
jgi:hypothetical protein